MQSSVSRTKAQDAEDQAQASVNSSLTYMSGPALQVERKAVQLCK